MGAELKNLTELTDSELLELKKKNKTDSIIDGFIIGFLFGILVYAVVKSNFGVLTFLLLYPIYKLIKKPRYKKADIKQELKDRNLK